MTIPQGRTTQRQIEPRLIPQEALARAQSEMFGVDDVLRLCLIALYCKGHILLEGNPGLGKTQLVKTLSRVLSLPYKRIQFTPDLMPTDITGTEMPTYSDEGIGKMAFKQGPVFASLLLADEINRATPKTQAAMLEAMAEQQVTVLGNFYPISKETVMDGVYNFNYGAADPAKVKAAIARFPFLVLATQNPVEQEGTNPLPEAQYDRFMFKVLMPSPSAQTLAAILNKTAGIIPYNLGSANGGVTSVFQDVSYALNIYERLNDDIRKTEVQPLVYEHIQNLYFISNDQADLVGNVRDRAAVERFASAIRYGLGPRAAQALVLGAKAWALFFIGTTQADPAALSKVALPVLRHRLKLVWGWESQFSQSFDEFNIDPERHAARKLDLFLMQLCKVCCPNDRRYYDIFDQNMDGVFEGQTC